MTANISVGNVTKIIQSMNTQEIETLFLLLTVEGKKLLEGIFEEKGIKINAGMLGCWDKNKCWNDKVRDRRSDFEIGEYQFPVACRGLKG